MKPGTKEFLTFLAFMFGWAWLCSFAIGLVHPGAIFAVWLIGFLWGVGFIVGGLDLADLLLKRWLQMMAGISILAVVLAFALS